MDATAKRPRISALAGAAIAIGLVLSTLATVDAAAQEPAPLPRSDALACPPGAVPESGFTDLVTVHEPAIECLAWYGITSGTTETTFSPGRTATRGQIATLLVRLLDDHAGVELPDPTDQGFDDVAGTTHADSINQLAELGLVFGFGDNTFRPNAPIQRGQFASLLFRVHAHLTGDELPPGEDRFPDVPGTTHEDTINALAGQGVLLGFADGTFRPTADITRGQLASVLIRHIDLLVEAGLVATPAGAPTSQFLTQLSWAAEVDTPAGEEPDDPRFGQGEEGAIGSAILTLFAEEDLVCYELATEAGPTIANPDNDFVGAHLHVGGFAENGPIVVGFDLPELVDDHIVKVSSGCTDDFEPGHEDLVDAVEADPRNYYVNIHTQDHPAGAVRGQLGATSNFLVELSWRNVVDDDGDVPVFEQGEPGATGEAFLQLFGTDPVEICFALRTDAEGDLTGAHLHEGAIDENGPVVIPFDPPLADGEGDFRWSAGCVPQAEFADGDVLSTLEAAGPVPDNYYVQIHSDGFPGGAVRGQLPDGGQEDLPAE